METSSQFIATHSSYYGNGGTKIKERQIWDILFYSIQWSIHTLAPYDYLITLIHDGTLKTKHLVSHSQTSTGHIAHHSGASSWWCHYPQIKSGSHLRIRRWTEVYARTSRILRTRIAFFLKYLEMICSHVVLGNSACTCIRILTVARSFNHQ